MSRPTTLLEGLCVHALAFGATSIEVEYRDGREWVFANIGGVGTGIANFESASAEAEELRENLFATAKKPVRIATDGRVYVLKVRIVDSFGEDAFEVTIEPAPKLDPSRAPKVPPSSRRD